MNTIIEQYKSMIQAGKMPVFEYTLNNDDYLLVHLSITGEGLTFKFDLDGLEYKHDDDIKQINEGCYLLAFDPYFDHLDYYLQAIDESITESYLFHNNLLPVD